MTKTHAAAHHKIQAIKRSAGRSAVAAAAYRHNAHMIDERTGLKHNYQRKGDLIAEGVVGWSDTPSTLWNAAEKSENRKNSITAREIVLALPHELDLATQERLIRGHCLMMRDSYGVACSWVIHDPEKNGGHRNDHAHIMITSREVAKDGTFGKKTRILDDRTTGSKEFEHMRAAWAKRVNAALEKAGVKERIDHRSHERRAEAGDAPPQEPQRHMGPKMTAIARKHKAAAQAAKAQGKPEPIAPRFVREAKRIRVRNAALWGLFYAHEAANKAANTDGRIEDRGDGMEAQAIDNTAALFETAMASPLFVFRLEDRKRREKERQKQREQQARHRPTQWPQGGGAVQLKHTAQKRPQAAQQSATSDMAQAALTGQANEPEQAKNVVLLQTAQQHKPPQKENSLVQALKDGLAELDKESKADPPQQLELFPSVERAKNQDRNNETRPAETTKRAGPWLAASDEFKQIFRKSSEGKTTTAPPDHEAPKVPDAQPLPDVTQAELFEDFPEINHHSSTPSAAAQKDAEHTEDEKAALIEMAAKSMLPPDGHTPRWVGKPIQPPAPPVLKPKKERTRGPPQK